MALLALCLLPLVLMTQECTAQSKSVPSCASNSSLELNGFTISTGTGTPTYDTNVYLCYKGTSLLVRYEMDDEGASSPYTECNQDLYKADAVEMFIATSFADTYHSKYIEVELNPNGALFLSLITNDCDSCSCITGAPQQCDNKEAVQFYNASVAKNGDHWSTEIEVSLPWIASLTSNGQNATQFQANFFRVDDLRTGQQLSAYNPTEKNPACFHVPSKFVNFQLAGQ